MAFLNKIRNALGISSTGDSPGRPHSPGLLGTTGLGLGSGSALSRHERSLADMEDFARELQRFEKQTGAFRETTERYLNTTLAAMLRDIPLPRMYDTTPAAPGAGGLGELAVVEPPPPTAHPELYSPENQEALLSSGTSQLLERFQGVMLPASVWLGTFEDAKLRLNAAHKLEQRAFGRKHSTLHSLLHPGRDKGDKDKDKGDKDRQGRDQQAKEGGDTATPTTAMGALAAAVTGGGGGTDAAAPDPTAASTATTTGGTSAAEEQLQQSQVTDPEAAREYAAAEVLLAEEVGWLVRQASHLRAWVAGSLRDLTAGLPAGLGPGGLLEPVPARIVAAPMTRRGKHPPATPHDVADTHQAAGGAAAATQPPPTAGSVTPTATSHERGGAGVGMGAAPAAAPGTAPEGVAGRVDEGVVAQAAKGLCTVGAGGPVPPSDTEGAAEGARRGGGAGVPAATFG